MDLFKPSSWFRPETKASEAGYTISGFGAGQPVWNDRNYENFAEESYIRNAIDYRCMVMVAQAVASVPYILTDKGDKEIESHKLLDLLKSPAPRVTLSFLLESLATYYQIAGNAYLEGVGPDRANAPPIELWTLRPDRMKVIAGRQGLPQGYVYEANGKKKQWDVDPVSGDCKVLHLKRFHPIDDWYGLAGTEPAAYAVDRHNEAGSHNMAVLQNGATPSGMLVYKPMKGKDGNDVSAPHDVIERAEKRLTDRHSGPMNAGRPMVSNGNIDWLQFGLNMEQLQLIDSKLDAAQDICIARGVPIALLLPGQSTYNNIREAKLSLYEETVLPLAETIIDHLNVWLCPKFGDGLKLKPNYDEVEAISLRRELRQTATTNLYESGMIGRDEAREALQFEPQPDMPQRKIDAAVLDKLLTAAQNDEMMFEPLWRYLRYAGLVDRDQTFEQFVAGAADLMASLGGDEEEEVEPELEDEG